MVRSLFPVALLAALLVSGLCAASVPPCPAQFAGGQAPDLLNPKLAARSTLLCFEAFAVGYSGLTRTPLWSAEYLTAARLDFARGLPREGVFHPEPLLPGDDAAALSDYAESGFDRGHLAPNGDMPTPSAQGESFTLANIVPQSPALNRGLWEGIESAVRGWTAAHGQLYVVTGPVFSGARVQSLGGRVLVPTLMFKAVYDPVAGRGAAYLARNADDGGYQTISLAQLTQLSGIDVFPGVPAAAKMRAVRLPPPIHRAGAPRARRGSDPDLVRLLFALLPRSLLR